MTRGAIYFNRGRKCRVRMLVSLYTLRRVYGGEVAVLHEEEPDAWFRAECERMGAQVVVFPKQECSALCVKPRLHQWSPFDVTLFLDADTIVQEDPSPLFDVISRAGFMTYHFADWRTTGSKIRKRIEAWRPVIGAKEVEKALAYGRAVNTGIHGYRKDSTWLSVWSDVTDAGWEANCTRRLIDEVACQTLLHALPHELVGPEWGASVRFDDPDSAKIIHYHGSKHCLEFSACERWKAAYWEYRNTSPAYDELGLAHGDKRFRRYLKDVVRDDITIVTAVNPAYTNKLASNWPLWMALPGIREQRFLVFWNRKCPAFLRQYHNVTLRRWKWDVAGDNIRERMLSAFVFGTAKHVKTAYWMKLDADATPTGVPWEWPDYASYTITGHKCGRTVTKGQVDPPKHFLNQLDDWHGGDAKFPLIDGKTHGHSRVASFCWIEETQHTRNLEEWCANQLPVPSQDTTSWYFAWRHDKPINRLNMRRWFRP